MADSTPLILGAAAIAALAFSAKKPETPTAPPAQSDPGGVFGLFQLDGMAGLEDPDQVEQDINQGAAVGISLFDYIIGLWGNRE